MITVSFSICTIISVIVILLMVGRKYENVDIHYWSIMVLMPIILLAYTLKTVVQTQEAAKILFCFIYLDSSFLPLLMVFSVFRFLNISVKRWVEVLVYLLAFGHIAMVCLCIHNDLYYGSMTLINTGMGIATKMTSGPLKIIHWVYIVILAFTTLFLMFYGYICKKTASHRTLAIFTFIIATCIAIYAVEMFVNMDFSLLPYLYVIGDLLIAIDYDRIHCYDISCLISEQQKYNSEKGFIAFDLNRRFLSCNNQVFTYLPELKMQRTDTKISDENQNIQNLFYPLIEDYEKTGSLNNKKFNFENKIYQCEISTFSVRKNGKIQGYLFDIRDVTEEQKIYEVMKSYNTTLNDEVQKKTEKIYTIQQKVVLGLANTIENRDNNTGGHVKRTSDIIQLLIKEIEKENLYFLTDQNCVDIVRAAPMHDLGKIAVDNSILCKPSKLTDEEYALMKTHSQKSGEIVKLILEDVEEQHFVDTAFNIARFHHERWDGRGYPEGLSGTSIPVEARIMAVADVYDALVSKRCYKEAMSFDKAAQIMCDNMGSQFDPSMFQVFLNCRAKLEEYYRIANNS